MLKDINLLLKVLFHLCYIDRGISHKSTKGGLSSHILFFGLYITFSGRPSLVIKTGLANIFFTLILAVFFLCNVYYFSNYAIKCVVLSYLPSLTTQLHKTKDYAYFINLFQVLWREGGKKGKMRGSVPGCSSCSAQGRVAHKGRTSRTSVLSFRHGCGAIWAAAHAGSSLSLHRLAV